MNNPTMAGLGGVGGCFSNDSMEEEENYQTNIQMKGKRVLSHVKASLH